MPLINQIYRFIEGEFLLWQSHLQDLKSILKGNHRGLGSKVSLEVKQKQHCQKHHCHMMMPSSPTCNLIFIEPSQSLGILQGSLHPVTPALPFCHSFDGNRLACIAEGELNVGAIQFLADEQPTRLRSGVSYPLSAIPEERQIESKAPPFACFVL